MQRPNLLLITLDTTRADHLGAYGDARAETPALDRLARDGVLFERAVTAAPTTLPAHVSVMTGLYPFAHGVRNNGAFTLAADVPTLASVTHDAGYRTAAFVSAFVLDRRYGLARGFDVYDDRFELERRGDATAAAASAWLGDVHAAAPSTPFFLWIHLYDPHDPYDPPSPLREAFADRPYDGEIAFADRAVGALLARLDALGLSSSTLVAVIGDHGESLGEHGEATHGMFIYEAAVRVPLIVRWPGRLTPGTRLRPLVRSIDLAPTLLEAIDRPPLRGAHGRSLLRLLDRASRQASAGAESAYSETYFPRMFMNWSALRSIRDERWKYIDAPVPELYDLDADPGERTNLAAREPARAAALARAFAATTGGNDGAMAATSVDRETARKLAALGYIGAISDVPPTAAADRRPDPKAMIGVFNRLREANAAIQARRFADAEASARSVLKEDAGNAFATMILGRALLEQGSYRAAASRYRAYAELVPTSADAHHWIAVCESRLGNVDRAIAEDDAALSIDPRHAEAHALRGGLLAARGAADRAIGDLKAAVDLAPDNVPFKVGLARILIGAGRLDDADAELARALERQPNQPDAHAARAALLVARGQLEPAVAEFERALAVRPDADDVRLDLARTLERLGRAADARRHYAALAEGRDTPPDIRKAAREKLRPL
jgi:arylsulfatase A-like enzyme/tetratricopeptide (TPR) repeat protein